MDERAATLCEACGEQLPAFEQAIAHGSYDRLRPAIHLMKFEGMPQLAEPLGELLAQAMLKLHPGCPAQMAVVPVPLHRGKRSFNQSLLLARSALRAVHRAKPEWQLSLQPHLLRRIRRTESQHHLTRPQRRENLRGAFAAAHGVQGQHVLLVDDVYTTGATAAECTRVLLKAGAGSVRVATLARAGREHAIRWQPMQPTARDRPTQALH